MTEIACRIARKDDAFLIAEFNMAMARETEGKNLPEKVITAGVTALFDNPQYGFYLIAEVDGKTAGCLMITYEWSDWRNGLFWWIQSVYVLPEFRKMGVYRKMYRYIKEAGSKKETVCGFRLYVEKQNTIAQKTYENLGMTETCYNMYEELTTTKE